MDRAKNESAMDYQRPSEAKKRRILRTVYGMAGLFAVAAVTVGLSRLKPAAPTVPMSSVWTNAVKRGSIIIEVRGTGALLPVEMRWVPTMNEGRVDKILVMPGTAVRADAVLVELSNPTIEQAALDAEWAAQAAEAELDNLRVQLESQRLTQQAAAASLKHQWTEAELEAQADEELSKAGLVPKLILKKSRAKADELKSRYAIEEKRLAISDDSTKAQIAVQQARVQQFQAAARLKQQLVDSLKIRAGIDGVLQSLGDKDPLQVGQQLRQGENVARVTDPLKLKAEVRIPETQAKDIQLGQPAAVDTRNGVVQGEVVRIDPAVQNGTVRVDISLKGQLPKGARPDLSVEGTVQLERLDDAVYVGRPVHGQSDSTIQLFKLAPGGREAVKVPVRIGRCSVNHVQILQGLEPGDQVIISDMSRWDDQDRIRLD
jgi:HlyD family secretion protein